MNKCEPNKNERGFTLLTVLMILVIFSILGVSLLTLSSNTVKLTDNERQDQSVFYIAEAGAVQKLAQIEAVVEMAFDTVKQEYEKLTPKQQATYDFEGRFFTEVESGINSLSTEPIKSFKSNFGKKPIAFVSVNLKSEVENTRNYEIRSKGEIGKKNRTVIQNIQVTLNPTETDNPGIVGNAALYVNRKIDLAGGVKIYGDVYMNSIKPSDKKISGGAEITGKVIQGAETTIDLPPFPSFPRYNIPSDQKLTNNNGNTADLVKDGNLLINNYVTGGYVLNMKNNIEFKQIVLDSNYTLTINVGDSDREIVVDHLNVSNGHINIIGTGKLTIYVKEKTTMGSGSTINSNTTDVNKLMVYQKGSSPINLGGSQKIFGSLYAEKSNITFGEGGGFHGNITAGGTEVTVNGGTRVRTQLFLVPNANFNLAGGGQIRGTVIADTFIGTGGGSLTYNDLDSDIIIPGNPKKEYGDGNNLIKKAPLKEI